MTLKLLMTKPTPSAIIQPMHISTTQPIYPPLLDNKDHSDNGAMAISVIAIHLQTSPYPTNTNINKVTIVTATMAR